MHFAIDFVQVYSSVFRQALKNNHGQSVLDLVRRGEILDEGRGPQWERDVIAASESTHHGWRIEGRKLTNSWLNYFDIHIYIRFPCTLCDGFSFYILNL
jgi:hypothetical protein